MNINSNIKFFKKISDLIDKISLPLIIISFFGYLVYIRHPAMPMKYIDLIIKFIEDNFEFWPDTPYVKGTGNIFLTIYPEFFLILSLSLLIGFLVILDNFYNYKQNLTILTGKILISIYFLFLFLLNNNNYYDSIAFNGLLVSDNFTNLIKNIIIVSIIICVYISFNYLKAEKIYKYEYFLLIGLSSIGMLTIISSNDLITMYLGIEVQSLCFYILATIKVFNNFSTEAGLKYFILGAFASGILLFGCSFIYGALGTTNFSEMKLLTDNLNILNDNPKSLVLGIIFVIIAILFKLGAAPFHMWLPDVYEGVPTSVTALYAIVPKIAMFGLFVHLNLNLFQNNIFYIQELLMYSALLSIIIGTLGALYQVKIKRLLAYSAISHVGFLLIGLVSFNSWSIFALFFYIIIYILISINIFTILLVLRKVDNNLKIKKINEFAILFKSHPLLAINFCLILFSIAGIPPLVGFYSKLYIFMSAIKSEIYLIAVIAALFSVIASMYYIRLIKLMFFKVFDNWVLFREVTKVESLIISFLFFFNIFFFCYPEIFIVTIYNIILNLFY